MPYESFLSLSDDLANHDIFSRYISEDESKYNGKDSKLLVLGVLRYIGHSSMFDDVSEANGMSDDLNRKFVYSFIKYGSTALYKRWVIDENIGTNVRECEALFRLTGFNGCIGSSDTTHVGMLSCHIWDQTEHTGFKLNIPSRTYNDTVDHTGKVIGASSGHLATWND